MANLKSLLTQQMRQVASVARSQSSASRTSAAPRPAQSTARATAQPRYAPVQTAPPPKKPYEGYVAPTAPAPKMGLPKPTVPITKEELQGREPDTSYEAQRKRTLRKQQLRGAANPEFWEGMLDRYEAKGRGPKPSMRSLAYAGDSEGVRDIYMKQPHGTTKRNRAAAESAEREKKQSAQKEAADPNLDWLGVHAYTAKPIFEEMSAEDYAELDATQRAAVDFNGALAAALESDRASGKFESQLLDAARTGGWDTVQAPMIKALQEDLQLSGQGTDLKDFLSGRAGIATSSLEGLSEVKPSRRVLEMHGGEGSSKEGTIKSALLGSVEDLLKGTAKPTTDPLEARRNRDAVLTDMIRQRMSSILRENRREGGERLSLNEDQERTFDDLYSIVTGYAQDGAGGFKTDRDGLPQGIQINPGDVTETLYEAGLGNMSDEFYRYVDIRIREELNSEDTDQLRRKYLSLQAPGLLQKVGEG